jgi:4-hydroxyphenylacetate 3-monooxygenase
VGVRTGAEYLEGLKDDRRVLYNGDFVRDVTETPGFRNTARAIAQFYDFQNLPELRDLMTYETEDGDRAGMAFIEPRSKEDLRRRAAAYAAWAEVTCGFMGRSPDYMNAAMMAVGAVGHRWGESDPKWGEHAKNVYLDARRRDLALTHTFVQPFTNRFKPPTEQEATLRVVRETADGPVVRGAKGIATLAPWCDENMQILSPPLMDESHADFAIAFNHPVDMPGLTWVCRDVLDPERPLFDAPLSSRGLDEMDCMAVYDDVLIPWEQVYLYKDIQIANTQIGFLRFEQSLAHHVLIRAVAKTRFMLGLAHLLAESSQVSQFFNVQERLGDFTLWLLNLESLAIAAIEDAEQDPDTGFWYANKNVVRTSLRLFPEYNRLMVNHLVSMGGSGYVSTPQEATLEKFADLLEPYYMGASGSAKEKVQLFRMAWDLAGSGWGSRNELYERFFFGDQQRMIVNTYLGMDKTVPVEHARRILFGEATERQPFPIPERYGGAPLPPYTGQASPTGMMAPPPPAKTAAS